MPNHPLSQHPTARLSSRIKTLRQQFGMSQRELARASGLSPNTISLIERDETSPTADTLHKLASALRVSVTSFFEQHDIPSEIYFTRSGERISIPFHAGVAESLGTTGDPRTPIFPVVLTIEPGRHSGPMMAHRGQEFAYCLGGQVQYTILDEVYTLEAGDSLLFRSDKLHCWRNPGSVSAQFIMVMYNVTEADIQNILKNVIDTDRVTQMGDV